MNKADHYIIAAIKRIMNEGYKDVNPRPVWHDGTPAHTISVNGMLREYDIGAGEFPICTLRPIAYKTSIKEIMAIYQNQSNKVSEFERMGCGWWGDWMLDDGTIGRAYPYNLESHRIGEMNKSVVKVNRVFVDERFGEMTETEHERVAFGVGYLGNYHDVKNFTGKEIEKLGVIWEDMLASCYADDVSNNDFVHHNWHSFEQFLRDVRYIPQYFLAREDDFKGWYIDKDYYGSNAYSKDTCVFLHKSEKKLYSRAIGVFEATDLETGRKYCQIDDVETLGAFTNNWLRDNDGCIDNLKVVEYENTDEYVYRYELSRNQVVSLLNGLVNNPYGRRHIISFWHWANIDKKSLVECAYETVWNVRNDGEGNEYLDMTLVQRSGDLLTASCSGANSTQYSCLLMMVAKHCGYKVGVFRHYVANEQLYTRYFDHANELIRRYEEKKADEEKSGEKPHPNMTLKTAKTDFFEFSADDFVLENYEPMRPSISFEVAV